MGSFEVRNGRFAPSFIADPSWEVPLIIFPHPTVPPLPSLLLLVASAARLSPSCSDCPLSLHSRALSSPQHASSLR